MCSCKKGNRPSFRPWAQGGTLASWDPEDQGGEDEPIDTEDQGGEDEPIDTEDQGGEDEPIDTEDQGGEDEPIDTEDQGGEDEPIDTDEWQVTVAKRRSRATLRSRRRKSRRTNPLCGDYPPGRPGNERRSIKPELTGKLVVRLVPQLARKPERTLEDLATEHALEGLRGVLDQFDLNGRSRRLIARRGSDEAVAEASAEAFNDYCQQQKFSPTPKDIEPDEIVAWETQAADGPLPPLHSLAAYWRLDVNHKPGALKKILKRLNKLAEVSVAYPEVRATDPSNGGSNPFAGAQTYLDRAPFGIDAHWAQRHGGDGSGVKLVDMEQGWMPDHPDLANKALLIHGNNRDHSEDYQGHHGTAVVGEVIAANNRIGVVGIAPNVEIVGLASHFHDEPENGEQARAAFLPDTDSHVAEAIYAAVTAPAGQAPFLGKGDVLLIEAQRAYLPTEIDPADFDAIRFASSLGVIVVEAAGNGGKDLDKYRDARGAIFKRRGGGYRESGAIMVGAALGALPHNRKRASNYGSRVDCFAWGTDVVTTGYGDLHVGGGRNETYTADFSNTSAAAPIIAGAAICLQSMYKAKTGGGRHLSPGQMRALLADPTTGTRQGRRVRGHIGVMPNLRAIAENTLRIVPDVYSRDRVGATGAVPMARTSCSPDVFVTAGAAIGDPALSFGEGGSLDRNLALGTTLAPGADRRVYVRMRNRGCGDAEHMTVTVYRGPAATLVTPDRWREIGCTVPMKVPQGDTLTVAGPISWPKLTDRVVCGCDEEAAGSPEPEQEPDDGGAPYHSLITLIEGGADPTRLPPGLLPSEGLRARAHRIGKGGEPPVFRWGAYLAFMRRHNHVAIRNLHVIGGAEDGTALDFLITGPPAADRGRIFDLEVLQRLPPGSGISLEIPLTLASAMSRSATWEAHPNRQGFKRYRLPPLPAVPFCRIPLAAGAEHDCRFVLHGGVKPGHSVAIRQLYRGLEVGRVTFQFQ